MNDYIALKLQSESINRETLLELLKMLNCDDPESNHMDADRALLKYINDEEITIAFRNINKWYS